MNPLHDYDDWKTFDPELEHEDEDKPEEVDESYADELYFIEKYRREND